MHRLWSAIVCLLGCLLLGLVGCGTATPSPVVVRSVFVADPQGAPTPELARYGDAIHDASVRTLIFRGYLAATEPSQSEAILRPTWIARPYVSGQPDGKVSLRLNIEDHAGRVLQTFDVIREVPAGLLTQDRVTEAVRTALSAMPPVRGTR